MSGEAKAMHPEDVTQLVERGRERAPSGAATRRRSG
jgi:hypothetical protein